MMHVCDFCDSPMGPDRTYYTTHDRVASSYAGNHARISSLARKQTPDAQAVAALAVLYTSMESDIHFRTYETDRWCMLWSSLFAEQRKEAFDYVIAEKVIAKKINSLNANRLLRFASRCGNERTVRLLLNTFATMRDTYDIDTRARVTVLIDATEAGSVRVAKALLQFDSIDKRVDMKQHGPFLLRQAVRTSNMAIVDWLLSLPRNQRPDIHANNDEILRIAVLEENEMMVRRLEREIKKT